MGLAVIMTDSKKLKEIDLETKGSSALYGLWSVGFLSAFMNIAIIMSSAWLVSNRKESMALAIGNEYWKGVFAQCASTGRFHFHCDNYEVPWILFDAIVLSVRVMMVLALIFIILAQLIALLAGNWNHLSSGMEIKTRSGVVILSGILYLLAGCFLITTAGLFTGVIMHQYAYDGKYGPRNGHAITKKIEENGVRYEFGACLYIAYVFGFIEIVLGIVHFIVNPFKTQSDLSDSQSERLDALGQQNNQYNQQYNQQYQPVLNQYQYD